MSWSPDSRKIRLAKYMAYTVFYYRIYMISYIVSLISRLQYLCLTLKRLGEPWWPPPLTMRYQREFVTSAPLSWITVHAEPLRMRTNVVDFRVIGRLYRREWNWLCVNQHPWQRTRGHGEWRRTSTCIAHCQFHRYLHLHLRLWGWGWVLGGSQSRGPWGCRRH